MSVLGVALALPVSAAGPPSPVPAGTRQVLLALAPSWDAPSGEARLYERRSTGSAWRPVSARLRVSFGRAGLAWGEGLHRPVEPPAGPVKREGDGRSPAGVFALRGLVGYAPAPPDGVRIPYRQASASLRCVDDPASPHYNQLVDEAQVTRDWTSAEDLRRPDDLYRWVVWVGHNDAPPRAGAGSCIFLHLRARADAVTAGCTAFDAADMEALLRQIDPAAQPVLVQLPRDAYVARVRAWGLPSR